MDFEKTGGGKLVVILPAWWSALAGLQKKSTAIFFGKRNNSIESVICRKIEKYDNFTFKVKF